VSIGPQLLPNFQTTLEALFFPTMILFGSDWVASQEVALGQRNISEKALKKH
jgi:hypothetical protein